MEFINKRTYTLFLMIWFLNSFQAETFSQEYKYEIGGIAGTSFYMGDANKTRPFLNPGLSGGALLRYNFTLHWALKASLL